MDGNGQWPRASLPRVMGHHKHRRPKTAVRFAKHRGIKALTVYAFSTENWAGLLKKCSFYELNARDIFKKSMSWRRKGSK